MSKFTAIWAVSKTLQTLLETEMKADPQFSTMQVPISLESPRAIRAPGSAIPSTSLSIWLYRVTRNEFTLNNRPPRTVLNQLPYPPIPVDLYYLITPMNEDPESQQVVLGKVLQVFNDRAVLRGSDLQASLQGGTEELRLILEALTLEELTRVWHSLQEPYQLSLSYNVQVVTIESNNEPLRTTPVEVRETTYAQIL
jgi:hypothetical protein